MKVRIGGSLDKVSGQQPMARHITRKALAVGIGLPVGILALASPSSADPWGSPYDGDRHRDPGGTSAYGRSEYPDNSDTFNNFDNSDNKPAVKPKPAVLPEPVTEPTAAAACVQDCGQEFELFGIDPQNASPIIASSEHAPKVLEEAMILDRLGFPRRADNLRDMLKLGGITGVTSWPHSGGSKTAAYTDIDFDGTSVVRLGVVADVSPDGVRGSIAHEAEHVDEIINTGRYSEGYTATIIGNLVEMAPTSGPDLVRDSLAQTYRDLRTHHPEYDTMVDSELRENIAVAANELLSETWSSHFDGQRAEVDAFAAIDRPDGHPVSNIGSDSKGEIESGGLARPPVGQPVVASEQSETRPGWPGVNESSTSQNDPPTRPACVDEGSDSRLNWGLNTVTNGGCWIDGQASMSDCVETGPSTRIFDCPDGKQYDTTAN